jgi:Lipase (class 3)
MRAAPPTVGGSLEELLSSSRHSAIAYQKVSDARRSLSLMEPGGRSRGARRVLVGQYGQEGRARAYLTLEQPLPLRRRPLRLVCAFRGTASTLDLLGAVDIRPFTTAVRCDRAATVHRGFYEQFMALEAPITRDIAALLRGGQVAEVRFTGHSMGGGMAAIAATHYASNGVSCGDRVSFSCHAFGTPDFADAAFIEVLGRRVREHVSVTLANDIVPLLPVHPRFRNLPHELQLSPDGVAACVLPRHPQHGQQRHARDASVLLTLARMVTCAGPEGIVQGHACSAYVSAIQNAMLNV